MTNDLMPPNLLASIRALIQTARQKVVKEVNQTMVLTYFEIGRRIVENEQEGNERAGYAQETLKKLSKQLQGEFGRGFSAKNLRLMRQFFLTYQNWQTVSAKSQKLHFQLSWSHYCFLIRIKEEAERKFYELEANTNHWSLRELKRQFNSGIYERLALSRDKKGILELSAKGQILETPSDAIKDPYILEFLELKEETRYSESDLEEAIIHKIQEFLLELGKGFMFVARQKRISFSEKHFHIDLVFYNRILRCFVLIDLKIGELTHKDLGQMQMYVNYYDREIRLAEENKTIGLIICRSKNDALVEYTMPEENKQIFASQYQTVLPDKEQLKQLLYNQE